MSAMAVRMSEEMAVAEQLLKRLAPETGELLCEDEAVIAFQLRKRGWRLSRLVLSRRSLRKLATDPLRLIKLDWLTRDIERTAPQKKAYVFPFRLDAPGCAAAR